MKEVERDLSPLAPLEATTKKRELEGRLEVNIGPTAPHVQVAPLAPVHVRDGAGTQPNSIRSPASPE